MKRWLLVPILIFFLAFSIQSQSVNGYITVKDGQRVLHVYGTHYEMGYAQGYLLADDIMRMVEYYLIDYMLDGNVSNWNTAKVRAETKMQFGRFEAEVDGLYDGMVASGADLYVDALGHNLTEGDLKVWIAMYDVGLITPLCSSFAVWNGGEVLHARNMDFPYDPQYGYAANKFLIIAYEPAGGQDYMVATWPGAIAVGTGMNASGLAFTANVAPGPQDNTYSRNDYVPTGITAREILEDAVGEDDLFPTVWTEMASVHRTRSFNAQYTQPLGRGEVSIIIEADALGQEIRHATHPYIYATNHYIQRDNGYMGGSTQTRYQILTDELNELTSTGDEMVDQAEAQHVLQRIAISWPTILSIYLHPEQRSFAIAFGQTTGYNPVDLTMAAFVVPVHYTWAELFGLPPIPTDTPTPTDTDVPVIIPTDTDTPTNTPTPTDTPTETPSPTFTPTPTDTPTDTPTPTPTDTPSITNLTVQVHAGVDDVNEDGSTFTANSQTIWFGNGAGASWTGLRFTTVGIPHNATILTAHLDIYAAVTGWITVSFQFAAENAGNSQPFSSSSKPSQRPLTAAKVNHTSNIQWIAGNWYSLNDITTVVQEIVNRSDWSSGNALSVILRGTGGSWGRKFAAAFEGSSINAVKLVITYR